MWFVEISLSSTRNRDYTSLRSSNESISSTFSRNLWNDFYFAEWMEQTGFVFEAHNLLWPPWSEVKFVGGQKWYSDSHLSTRAGMKTKYYKWDSFQKNKKFILFKIGFLSPCFILCLVMIGKSSYQFCLRSKHCIDSRNQLDTTALCY